MSQFIFTDSEEEQNESVTKDRDFYIGGSEIEKLTHDLYSGDIIQNIVDKLVYTEDKNKPQPDWAEFGHKAEVIIRDFVNRKYKRNYKPAVAINNVRQSRTNVDGYDPYAEEKLWECKTYSGKLNIEKYRKQIVYYMLRNNIQSCLLTCLSKDVLDEKGKKIRNITLDELTDDELNKRLSFFIIKLEDNKVLAEQIDMCCDKYVELYSYISRSKIMQLFIQEYKRKLEVEDSVIDNFMKGF